MRIGIDISQIVYGTGVSVYTKNLIRNLLNLDRENDYVLYGGSLRRKNELLEFVNGLEGNFTSRLFPIPPSLADLIWNVFHTFKIENLVGKIDVFHSSDWAQPSSLAKKVTTVHDLVPLRFRSLSDKRLVNTHQRRLRVVRSEVDRVIVPSETTKFDLEKLGFDINRIIVIPEAANASLKKPSLLEISSVKRKFRIHEKFLLAVGTSARKNLDGIIKAYELVKAGKSLKLVVVGHNFTGFNPSRGIIFTGQVTDFELSALISAAEILVYPSFYEGFGLPILDAYKFNLPVVTSNIGSMKEVAGDAAVLVDPFSTDSIVKGIEEAFRNKKSLIKKGKKRLKLFNWEKTAKSTLDVYNSLK
jgi:glycosyltransferase involved in cell wall biosynthesis